ncbi:DNA cytosine methyltransferase [Candidatus Parcubacteria bacterium]|nr:DNA cytosine methyltransferase [Candidatus Parcubacteria bacterium]
MKKNQFKVLDLFSGCGGLSYGLESLGFKIILGIDNWDIALKTFKRNHSNSEVFLGDLAILFPKKVDKNFDLKKKGIDLIVGGPPCQGFSISGKRAIDDPRNKLYKSFVNFVNYFKPKAFIMENVPNLLSMGEGKLKKEIIDDFQSLGYKIYYKILLASDYGVPQNRRRVFFVGINGSSKYKFLEPTHGKLGIKKVTAKDAIGDLPEKDVADESPYMIKFFSNYQKMMRKRSHGIYNHEAVVHTEKTKKIISMVPDGGNYKDLPKNLQNTRKVNIAWTRFSSSKPSCTIDTGHNHHFHYKYNRVPTARESARLQSFDDSFIFDGKKNEQIKQIGNAVPPILAAAVGKKLLKILYDL